MYLGRVGAHDVAAFARDCSTTGVEVLGPADFPQRVQHSQHLWFVDFFAPVSQYILWDNFNFAEKRQV